MPPKITGNPTKTEVSLPASTVGQIGSRTDASLTITTSVAGVTIPNGGLSSLSSAGGTVTVAAERKSVASGGSVAIPLDGSAKLEILDNSKHFNDVPASGWVADAVAFASSHELFYGTGENQFSPNQSMSRGMLAVVLHNLESNPDRDLTNMFADVSGSEWYAESVAWAATNGIVSGYGDDRFGPNDSITREQLAVMLWRYADSPAAVGGELDFADADKISDWAMEALYWATENDVINGKDGGILAPREYATRAETAQMLKNFMEKEMDNRHPHAALPAVH